MSARIKISVSIYQESVIPMSPKIPMSPFEIVAREVATEANVRFASEMTKIVQMTRSAAPKCVQSQLKASRNARIPSLVP